MRKKIVFCLLTVFMVTNTQAEYQDSSIMDSIAHGSVPHASARTPLNSKPFSAAPNLGVVASSFQAALLSQGYGGQGWAFDAVSGKDDPLTPHHPSNNEGQVTGFTVITQIEQFDDQGKSLTGTKRWSISDTSADGGLVDRAKKTLLGAPIGHYRLFLLNVSVDPQRRIRQDIGAKYVQWDEYWRKKTYREPMISDLEKVYIGERKLHSFVLIYEFDRTAVDGEMVFRDTGRLSAEDHLKGSGLWQALNQDAR